MIHLLQLSKSRGKGKGRKWVVRGVRSNVQLASSRCLFNNFRTRQHKKERRMEDSPIRESIRTNYRTMGTTTRRRREREGMILIIMQETNQSFKLIEDEAGVEEEEEETLRVDTGGEGVEEEEEVDGELVKEVLRDMARIVYCAFLVPFSSSSDFSGDWRKDLIPTDRSGT